LAASTLRIMSARPVVPVMLSTVAMGATRLNITARAPRFADRLAAWGAAFLFTAFNFLPLDWASTLGGWLARRIGPFLGVSRHARRNISRAFPELSGTEIARVVAGMWDNLGRLAAEYPHLRKIRVFEPGGRVETVTGKAPYKFESIPLQRESANYRFRAGLPTLGSDRQQPVGLSLVPCSRRATCGRGTTPRVVPAQTDRPPPTDVA
jgi:hypothetical protein